MKQSLLSILLLCISIAVSAHDFVVDGIYYNIDDTNKTATVTYKGDIYNEYSKALIELLSTNTGKDIVKR